MPLRINSASQDGETTLGGAGAYADCLCNERCKRVRLDEKTGCIVQVVLISVRVVCVVTVKVHLLAKGVVDERGVEEPLWGSLGLLSLAVLCRRRAPSQWA